MKPYTDKLPRKGTPERELREEQWQQFPDTAPNKANPTPVNDLVGGPHNTTDTTDRQTAHSPLPWSATDLNGWCITSAGQPANVSGDVAHLIRNGSANAKLIVRAVNNADKLAEALRILVEAYVANLGRPDSEFIACITPPHASDMTTKERKKDSCWSKWDKARTALAAYEADRA